jgi:hypothetical protein
MCPPGICGTVVDTPGFNAVVRGGSGTYARPWLQRRQPRQERLVIPPDWLGAGHIFFGGWRFTEAKRRFLCPYCDLRIAVGGVEADMSQPAPNDIDIGTCLEHMNGTRMSKDVWAYVVAFRASL